MDKRILVLGSICVVLLLVSTSFASAVNTVTNVEKIEAINNKKQSTSISGNLYITVDGPHLLLIGKEYYFTFQYWNYMGFYDCLVEIDWGDGTTPFSEVRTEGVPFTISHTYNETGRYKIKATVSNSWESASEKHIVRVVTESQYPNWEKLIRIIGWIFIFTGGTFLFLIYLLYKIIN